MLDKKYQQNQMNQIVPRRGFKEYTICLGTVFSNEIFLSISWLVISAYTFG